MFLAGILIGFFIGYLVRETLPRIEYLWNLNMMAKKRRQDIKDGIRDLEKYINAQDWNDDD